MKKTKVKENKLTAIEEKEEEDENVIIEEGEDEGWGWCQTQEDRISKLESLCSDLQT